MKFTPKEEIRAKGKIFEAGNTYDSEKQEVDSATLERWHKAGWTEIEGYDPAPDRVVSGNTLAPDNAKITSSSEVV